MNRLRENLRNFAARGAIQRLQAYGERCEYHGVVFMATKPPTRDARTLRDGGFTLEADTSIRFPKTALRETPVAESIVSVAGREYRIVEVKDVTQPLPEWVLSLHSIG